MKKIFPAVTLFLVTSSSVFAQEQCKTIRDDAARLSCYDIALGVLESETEAVEDNGNWVVKTDVSPLTDDKNVFLSLRSENEVSGPYGGRDKGAIWLRCMENTTAVLITFNDHFMSDNAGGGRVEYRLDDASLTHANFRESNDNKALGLWNGGSAIPFIKRMLSRNQLIVLATPFSDSAITLTFNIAGIDNAISSLRETCNW